MRTLVLDVPGLELQLTEAVMQDAPAWFKTLASLSTVTYQPISPATTMPMQANLTTGVLPQKHGMIANGLPTWRHPEIHEHLDLNSYVPYRSTVSFWEQSANLVDAPRTWETSGRKTAILCVQSSMGAAPIVVTPKPHHNAPGGMRSDCWTSPPELADRLQGDLGVFPLMHYWGPMANLKSSQWILQAAKIVWEEQNPELQITYLPHMDYDLQRVGPNHPKIKDELLALLNAATPLVEAVQAAGDRVILLSEYGINEVDTSLAINSLFAKKGWIALDDHRHPIYPECKAFAMADHQVAHVYVNEESLIPEIESLLEAESAVEKVYVGKARAEIGLDHAHAGEIVVLAKENAWFEYRWWDDFAEAPEYAWSVDIHRKPGYDPTELFMDMATRRTFADQPEAVKGSHGVLSSDPKRWPVLIGVEGASEGLTAVEVAGLL